MDYYPALWNDNPTDPERGRSILYGEPIALISYRSRSTHIQASDQRGFRYTADEDLE